MELADLAHISLDDTAKMVEPAFVVVGHTHYVHYAYPRRDRGTSDVHILAESDRFEKLGTDSIRGIFRAVQVYRNTLDYGLDESPEGYWGGFMGLVLTKLAA